MKKALFGAILIFAILFSSCGMSIDEAKSQLNKYSEMIDNATIASGDNNSQTDEETASSAKTTVQNNTESSAEEAKEIIYKYDEKINKYLLSFNNLNPDKKIKSKDVERYYHHTSYHNDQIITYYDKYEVAISAEYNSIKIDLQTYTIKNKIKYASKKKCRNLFVRFAKPLATDMSEDDLKSEFNKLYKDEPFYESDVFECDISKYDNNIEFISIEADY